MSSWWKRANHVLKKEPETWLAYINGQQFHKLKHLQEAEPRFKGGFMRFLIWGYTLLRQTRLAFAPKASQCTFLVFAGTRNQKNALDATVDALKSQGESVLAIAPEIWLTAEDHAKARYQAIEYGQVELLKSLALLPMRFFSVYRQVRRIDPVLIQKRLDTFFRPHRSLVYFDRLLEGASPTYVIVSNDHNVENRALLALARERGIKTVYMQHASVSSLFPALNVDYAFLDGQAALETYRQCEANYPPGDPLDTQRSVFLSGQKKKVMDSHERCGKYIGLALNALDKTDDIKAVLDSLCNGSVPIKLRWHPGGGERAINVLLDAINSYPIEYSDPRKESIPAFFASIRGLVAGNSSIHLEAALCGIVPVYYEITPPETPDYYGYVKHGLAVTAGDTTELKQCLASIASGEIQLNREAVQYYSATFGTEWEGREGELVADTLIALDNESPTSVSATKL